MFLSSTGLLLARIDQLEGYLHTKTRATLTQSMNHSPTAVKIMICLEENNSFIHLIGIHFIEKFISLLASTGSFLGGILELTMTPHT